MSDALLKGPRKPNRRSSCGQVTLFTALVLSVVLALGAGLGVDMAGLWFHRQAAQSAADAACQAGALDLQFYAVNGSFPTSNPLNFTTDSSGNLVSAQAFICAAASPYVPCQYAAFNGYNGAGLAPNTPSNEVSVSFPTDLSGDGIGTPAGITLPFMKVVVTDRVQLSVAPLLTGTSTQDIRAQALCGLAPVQVPAAIVVLDPSNGPVRGTTNKGSFSIGGTSDSLVLIGGPPLSIQVNSTYASAAFASGNPTVDLSLANLKSDGTCPGGTFGVSGGPTDPANFTSNFKGTWVPHDAPVPDPFSGVATPAAPTRNGVVNPVGYGWSLDHSPQTVSPYTFVFCPDSNGCTRFSPGVYDKTVNLAAWNAITGMSHVTAIFDPGLYYIRGDGKTGGMNFGTQTLGRPSGASYYPDGTAISSDTSMNTYCGGTNGCWLNGSNSVYVGGTTFYFAGNGSINAGSTSGNGGSSSGSVVDCFGTLPGGSAVPCTNTGTPAGGELFAAAPTSCPSAGTSLPSCVTGKGPQTNAAIPALGIQVPCNQATDKLPTCPSHPFPASFSGHTFLGPCSATTTAPLAQFQVDTSNTGRGITFFDAHNNPGVPNLSGGGSMLIVGAMYFHQCTGANAPQQCQAPGTTGDYNDYFRFNGTPSASSYVFGDIVTDQIDMNGNSGLTMLLDQHVFTKIPKVFLIR
jgi:putative Flp pilus-assembly TadE/G-like protein